MFLSPLLYFCSAKHCLFKKRVKRLHHFPVLNSQKSLLCPLHLCDLIKESRLKGSVGGTAPLGLIACVGGTASLS